MLGNEIGFLGDKVILFGKELGVASNSEVKDEQRQIVYGRSRGLEAQRRMDQELKDEEVGRNLV